MKRLVAIIVILAVLGFGPSRAFDWWNFNVNTPISSTSHNVTFHVDLGESPAQIGSDLYDLHLIPSRMVIATYTHPTDAAPKFQSGSLFLTTNLAMVKIASPLHPAGPDVKT